MTATHDGWELPISEEQLAGLTRDMETAHFETLPAMRAGAVDLAEEIRTTGDAAPGDGPRDPGRRRFLLGAGGVAAAFALAGCGGSDTSSAPITGAGANSPSSSGSASTNSSTYTGDLKVVALAVALENQAVGAYKAALAAGKAGKLGSVPPAVSTFMTTAMAQHADHAKAWNAVLTAAGKPAISNVPLSNQASVTSALNSASSVGAVAQLALQLENQAAQTYLSALSSLTGKAGIATAATIAPVEAMHASILHFVLGQYPVPDTFLPTDKAANPGLLTV
ncbi:ferritin-like domain-containing protein [Streptomyces sp. NBC_01190]|uniref:ferritin-like domain-containing protein n=1 Tax=Streptomyces sp. NBC_01190 TaxID=2903767 RepID=UPI003864F2B9|nr:ferritin-like domain-containing protein [Streptomyces sp. NBC_01190]